VGAICNRDEPSARFGLHAGFVNRRARPGRLATASPATQIMSGRNLRFPTVGTSYFAALEAHPVTYTAVLTSNHRKQTFHTSHRQNTGGQRQLLTTSSQTRQTIPSRNELAQERYSSLSHTQNSHATKSTTAPRAPEQASRSR
jgi:hypothetical protein